MRRKSAGLLFEWRRQVKPYWPDHSYPGRWPPPDEKPPLPDREPRLAMTVARTQDGLVSSVPRAVNRKVLEPGSGPSPPATVSSRSSQGAKITAAQTQPPVMCNGLTTLINALIFATEELRARCLARQAPR